MKNPYQDAIDKLCEAHPGMRLHHGWEDEHRVEEEVLRLAGFDRNDIDAWVKASVQIFGTMFQARDRMVAEYSWAVPNEEAIRKIAGLGGPIIEWCAGLGYWTWLLREAGAKVSAFTLRPGVQAMGRESGMPKERRPWTEVLPTDGDERAVNAVIGIWAIEARTLLLVWPPYDDPVAYQCLRAFRGEYCVHVGEGSGGCTGCEKFHELLEAEWEEEDYINIPSWRGIRDGVWIWKRKAAAPNGRRLISLEDDQ